MNKGLKIRLKLCVISLKNSIIKGVNKNIHFNIYFKYSLHWHNSNVISNYKFVVIRWDKNMNQRYT